MGKTALVLLLQAVMYTRLLCSALSPTQLGKRSFWGLALRGGHAGSFSPNVRGNVVPPPSRSGVLRSTSEGKLADAVDFEDEKKSPVNDVQAVVDHYASIAGNPNQLDFGGLKYREPLADGVYRVVFVLGGPGAGKGTQSELLLDNYPCVHLSAGELLREETKKPESPHAELIEKCLVAGNIVPVEISLSLLENAMREAPGKSMIYLVDGFPRNDDNLDGWSRCMSNVATVLGVLYYQCPLPILEDRILARAKNSGRSDDNLSTLRRRFGTFNTETVPVVENLRLLKDRTLLRVCDIDGNQEIEKVWQDTQRCMNSFLANDVIAANVQLLTAASSNDVESYQCLVPESVFAGRSPSDVLTEQEGQTDLSTIQNAKIDFISGTKATVSYDCIVNGLDVRETRVWSHEGAHGWQTIHFSRVPRGSK